MRNIQTKMSICPKHGREKTHLMILNRYVTPWEFEALFFSCGRFILGTIEGKGYRNPDHFIEAFEELMERWKQEKEFWHHWGSTDLESYYDAKLGIGEPTKPMVEQLKLGRRKRKKK